MQSRSSIPVYFPVLPNIFRFGGKKFPVMSLREFSRNPLTKHESFRGQTAAGTLKRRDSRLFSRITGIGAGVG